MDNKTKFNIWYVVLALWGIILLRGLWIQATQIERIPYSQFQTYLAQGRVKEVRIG
jgi:cell division protease FtsH